MIKPTMPNMPNMPQIPGMEAMTDTLEFVKNLWGSMGIPGMNMTGMNMPGMNIPGMNIPGMVMPTLSVDEINKRISDLKAVESWLGLNMGMLRSTIQALEVQAATIGTLQSMSAAFASSMSGFKDGAPAANGSSTGHGAGAASRGDGAGEGQSGGKDAADAAMLTAPLVNAAAWWGALQDQFSKAVSTAMENSAAAAPAEKETPEAQAKPRGKSDGPAGGTRRRNGKQEG